MSKDNWVLPAARVCMPAKASVYKALSFLEICWQQWRSKMWSTNIGISVICAHSVVRQNPTLFTSAVSSIGASNRPRNNRERPQWGQAPSMFGSLQDAGNVDFFFFFFKRRWEMFIFVIFRDAKLSILLLEVLISICAESWNVYLQ